MKGIAAATLPLLFKIFGVEITFEREENIIPEEKQLPADSDIGPFYNQQGICYKCNCKILSGEVVKNVKDPEGNNVMIHGWC